MASEASNEDPSERAERPPEHGHAIAESESLALPTLLTRSAIGGVLMGLANLVPGISGGTMLLAAGVYPTFINAIAELTTLHFKPRSMITLGGIAGSAALAILLLAGTMKTLVVDQRWLMYSLFIGLTLGGIPLVWKLAKPATPGLWAGAAGAFLVMVVMSLGGGGGRSDDANFLLLLLSGAAGASAMILPGISGGYLLLLLGQYEPILGGIDQLKTGLFGVDGGGPEIALLYEAMKIVVPVGLGVGVGVVGVSNLLRVLLDRYEKPTLGILLGLLLGSVVGLYPFQEPVRPEAGFVHRGVVLDEAAIADLKPKYWPLERFAPGAGQLAGSAGLVLLGLGATLLVARIGGHGDDAESGSLAGSREP
jgi:putative membrane protein